MSDGGQHGYGVEGSAVSAAQHEVAGGGFNLIPRDRIFNGAGVRIQSVYFAVEEGQDRRLCKCRLFAGIKTKGKTLLLVAEAEGRLEVKMGLHSFAIDVDEPDAPLTFLGEFGRQRVEFLARPRGRF